MAWDFGAEIHALSNFDADLAGTTGSISGENLTLHANQWLTDGAKEIINLLPMGLQKLCTAMQTFTSVAADSESETLNTGKVLAVFAGSKNCRNINCINKYKASDPDDINYATSNDPVFYVEANKINVLPAGLSCKYEEVQYPTVEVDYVAIAIFPDEAEYLVVLYASMKALQHKMTNEVANEDSGLYALYSDRYTKLSADYQRGIVSLRGGKK